MSTPDTARMHAVRSGMFAIIHLLLLAGVAAHAQVSTNVTSISPAEATAKRSLTIRAELLQAESIERVYLVYRSFGASDYTRVEMDVVGNIAAVTVPAQEIAEPFFEYYLVLANRSGVLESYPLSEGSDPFSIPPGKTLRIPVGAEETRDAEIVFLSPDPASRTSSEDLVIAISLLRADTIVVRRATQILLDGADISADAVMSDDMIVYAPGNLAVTLSPGQHRVTVRLFNRDGNLHRSANLGFTISGAGQLPGVGEPGVPIRYGVSAQLESRHEQISSKGTWYNRGGLQFDATSGVFRFTSNLFITSDEKSSVQPQNRYFAGLESPWVRVGYGDSYPSFPNLVLSGKRVRGLTSAVRLDFFNVDLVLGKTNRGIEGQLLKRFPLDSLSVEMLRDPTSPYAPIDDQTWGKFSYGTYARDLFAIRPSFGSGETWQWGLTWLKAKDDTSSISYGIRPQENLVVGTDFTVKLDEHRIEIAGQGAFSAFNSDISSGNFSDAYIDSVYPNDASRLKDLRDILSDFITVNDNLKPLSFKRLSTLSYELSLGLNYFENGFRFLYLFRGSDYNSFGQTFLRKDIQGFNITDRIRLAENQVFAVLGFERLQDNTSRTRPATTTFTNVNIALSYYSRTDIPSATIGFSSFNNTNGLSPGDTLNAVDDGTVRFYLQSTYDFGSQTKHTASFNLSTSTRDDRSAREYDVENVTLSLGLSTRYAIPLQTSIDFGVNLNTLPSASGSSVPDELNYTSLSFNAQYTVMRGQLLFRAGVSPTFGDFRRTGVDLGGQWHILPLMSVELQFAFYDNNGVSTDNIWSLRCRYDL